MKSQQALTLLTLGQSRFSANSGRSVLSVNSCDRQLAQFGMNVRSPRRARSPSQALAERPNAKRTWQDGEKQKNASLALEKASNEMAIPAASKLDHSVVMK
jgi:hypothetical protein